MPWRVTHADRETALRRAVGGGTALYVGAAASGARLRRWFSEVVSARTACDALALAHDEAVILALVDVGPDTDGLAFLRDALEFQPRLALVAVVSDTDAASLRELLELKVDCVFVPQDDEQLLERIHHAVASADLSVLFPFGDRNPASNGRTV